jgi:hypothetical protein
MRHYFFLTTYIIKYLLISYDSQRCLQSYTQLLGQLCFIYRHSYIPSNIPSSNLLALPCLLSCQLLLHFLVYTQRVAARVASNSPFAVLAILVNCTHDLDQTWQCIMAKGVAANGATAVITHYIPLGVSALLSVPAFASLCKRLPPIILLLPPWPIGKFANVCSQWGACHGETCCS